MLRHRSAIWWSWLATLFLVGCVMERRHVPLTLSTGGRLVELSEPAAVAPRLQPSNIQQASATDLTPRNVLVLSGGGANGAYTVGVLNGWTASGQRPQFDVVTGISTGALIAPFAFLGSEYDETLRRSYTECKEGDIFNRRWLPALLWADSLADSTPLKKRIASEITTSILARIAVAHRDGRRLYVGTTDLDSKRLVVWDLGAIAAGSVANKLELFRDVLLASASVPGLLPPVDIHIEVDGEQHTELHVDGGVSASLFLQPSMLGVKPDQENPEVRDDLHVYVVVAGQLQLPRRTVKRRLSKVFEESIGGVLQSQMEGDLLKTYLLARYAGAQFALTSVPKELTEEASSLAFDPRIMQVLFKTGYDHAATRVGWQFVPVSVTLDEQTPPRSSVQFKVQEPRTGRENSASVTSARAESPIGLGFTGRNFLQRLRSDRRR